MHWMGARRAPAPSESAAPPGADAIARALPESAAPPRAGAIARALPEPAQLPGDGLPSSAQGSDPEGAARTPDGPDWQALASEKIEREVSGLRGARQVSNYLDQLLAEARQRGAVTPLETSVAAHAIRSLSDVSDEERDKMLSGYQERLLAVQASLQAPGEPAARVPEGPHAADDVIAALRRGGQQPAARAELRQEVMRLINELPAAEREAKLAQVHDALAGERNEPDE